MDAGYATVDRLNAQNPIWVDIEPIKLAAAQRWIQHSGGLVDPATTKLVNDLLRKPNLVSFRDAAQLRSDLMKLRDPEAVVQGQVPAMGESLSQAVDRQIDLAGNALNPRRLLPTASSTVCTVVIQRVASSVSSSSKTRRSHA